MLSSTHQGRGTRAKAAVGGGKTGSLVKTTNINSAVVIRIARSEASRSLQPASSISDRGHAEKYNEAALAAASNSPALE